MSVVTAPEAFAWSQAYAGRVARIQPSAIREFLKLLGSPDMISFAGGIPDPELFPVAEIERLGALVAQHLGRASTPA